MTVEEKVAALQASAAQWDLALLVRDCFPEADPRNGSPELSRAIFVLEMLGDGELLTPEEAEEAAALYDSLKTRYSQLGLL